MRGGRDVGRRFVRGSLMGTWSGLRVWLSAPGRLVRSPWIAIPVLLIAGLGGPLLVLDQSVSQAAGKASLATDLAVCPFDVGLGVVRDVPVPGAVTVPGQPAPRTLDQVTAALDKEVGASADDRVITLFGGTVSLVDPVTGKKVE